MTRREFLKSGSASAGLAIAATSFVPFSKVRGANDRVRVAVIGINGKGGQHIGVFRSLENVQVAALCDVDKDVLARERKKFTDDGEDVETVVDMRRIFDRKDIDAVVIATPNHWHSLAGIWACQAGKHAYVEKPISHNVWEGRQLVKAANKYKRIVQAGTQNRSDIGLRAFMDYKKENDLGAVQWVYGLWYKRRDSIGKVAGPQTIPASVDYDLFTGPARMEPLMRENLHYDWHWIWNYGNGDMANIGVHQIDDCRFLAGLDGLPTQAFSFGERWGYVDDGETPNTHLSVFDYDNVPLYIEIRGLPAAKGANYMDAYRGVRMGNVIKFENGYFVGGRGGGWFRDNDFNKVKQFPGDGGGTHQQNFIDAIRADDSSMLRAPIEECHYSSSVCHMANTSYRIGQHTEPAAVAEAVRGYDEAVSQFQDFQRHLNANEIDLQKNPICLGPKLTMDKKEEKFTGDWSYEGNMYLSRNYRPPFIVPDKV